jgi:hypothetical protein
MPNYNHRCYVAINKVNDFYELKINENGMEIARYFDGIYRAEPYSNLINKYAKYLLTDINNNDSLLIEYGGEQITGDVITSFTIHNIAKKYFVFCFKN